MENLLTKTCQKFSHHSCPLFFPHLQCLNDSTILFILLLNISFICFCFYLITTLIFSLEISLSTVVTGFSLLNLALYLNQCWISTHDTVLITKNITIALFDFRFRSKALYLTQKNFKVSVTFSTSHIFTYLLTTDLLSLMVTWYGVEIQRSIFLMPKCPKICVCA